MAKKKAAKKVKPATDEAGEQTPTKQKRERKPGGGRKQAGKNTIVFFMGHLVAAGYLGEEIPEESGPQNKAAQLLRQMAEKLARQTRKFGEGDIELGGGSEGEEEGTEE